jgi:hypothetical protein
MDMMFNVCVHLIYRSNLQILLKQKENISRRAEVSGDESGAALIINKAGEVIGNKPGAATGNESGAAAIQNEPEAGTGNEVREAAIQNNSGVAIGIVPGRRKRKSPR